MSETTSSINPELEAPVDLEIKKPKGDLAKRINAEHQAAHRAAKTAVAHAIAAGVLLIEAKGRIHHGQWLAWLSDNFDFSAKTATGYMRLALLPLAKRQRVADLSLRQVLGVIAEPKTKTRSALISATVSGSASGAANSAEDTERDRGNDVVTPPRIVAQPSPPPRSVSWAEQMAALLLAWVEAAPDVREAFVSNKWDELNAVVRNWKAAG